MQMVAQVSSHFGDIFQIHRNFAAHKQTENVHDRASLPICYNAALTVSEGGYCCQSGHSSVVEHLNADQEVPQFKSGCPLFKGSCALFRNTKRVF